LIQETRYTEWGAGKKDEATISRDPTPPQRNNEAFYSEKRRGGTKGFAASEDRIGFSQDNASPLEYRIKDSGLPSPTANGSKC